MNKYNIIAIEPNRDVKEAYEEKFGKNIKVYRDKKSFEKAHNKDELYKGFTQKLPLVLVMETTFSEELDDRLEDAPRKEAYPLRMFEKLTDEEKTRKSLNLGLGIELAKEIRYGMYNNIERNIPIVFATWLADLGAEREIKPIPRAYHVSKDSIIVKNKIYADRELLCKKLENMLDRINTYRI